MKRDFGLWKKAIERNRFDVWRARESPKNSRVERNFTESTHQPHKRDMLDARELTKHIFLLVHTN